VPAAKHIDSWYAASANPAPDREPLRDDLEVDVCVVGGGIAGCSTALHLAERGYRVVVLEGKRVAWGASGRSGGQAIVGYACSQDKLLRQVGRDDARRMFDISVEAQQLIQTLIERHEIRCDLHWGHLHVAIKPRQVDELLAHKEELERDYGYGGTRWLDRTQLGELLNTERYIGALRDDRSGHLHPLNYTLGVAAAAERAGARIFESTQVVSLSHGDSVQVKTASGATVRAKHVALCCNAFMDERISRHLRDRIMPVGTYIVATERLGQARIESLMHQNLAVSDINFVLDYFRRSEDHRLLFGGRVSYSGRDALNTANASADGEGVPAARRHEDRVRLGRPRRHHDEPCAGLRADRAERLLPAGVLGAWHCADRHGGQAGRGDDCGPVGALRPVYEAAAPQVSGRAGAAHAGAGAGDAVVQVEGLAVTTALACCAAASDAGA
jgi:gamma-glutamylputrescine oxidase